MFTVAKSIIEPAGSLYSPVLLLKNPFGSLLVLVSITGALVAVTLEKIVLSAPGGRGFRYCFLSASVDSFTPVSFSFKAIICFVPSRVGAMARSDTFKLTAEIWPLSTITALSLDTTFSRRF